MKFRELIDTFERTDENHARYGFEVDRLASALGLTIYNSYVHENSFLQKYWYQTWICTDTQVGVALYYLGDQCVAISIQDARKSDEDVFLVSEQAAIDLRNWLIALDGFDEVQYVDMDAYVPDFADYIDLNK